MKSSAEHFTPHPNPLPQGERENADKALLPPLPSRERENADKALFLPLPLRERAGVRGSLIERKRRNAENITLHRNASLLQAQRGQQDSVPCRH